MAAVKFDLPFVKKEKLNDEVFSFQFDRKAFKFSYLAGQYFRTTLQMDNPDERGSSRYFTISSSPNEKFLTITTKVNRSSFKQRLNSLIPGDKMTFFGPFGEMYQDKKDLTSKIMIAGGVGLTPALSMLKFIDEEKLKVNFILLASFSKKEDVILFKELREIESRNSNISIVYCVTSEVDLMDFEKGRVDEKMIRRHAPNILNSKVFLGGPPGFSESINKIIKQIGVLDENILMEDFTGY